MTRTNLAGMAVLLAAVLAVVPVIRQAHAGPLQVPHLTRFQGGKAPLGFRTICGQYPWACSNRSQGRITGDGPPATLAQTHPVYSRMCELQKLG